MKPAVIAIGVILAILVFFTYFYNPGKTANAKVIIGESDKFSNEEIQDAVKTVKSKFRSFSGCELTRIEFDEKSSDIECDYYIKNRKMTDKNVIVLYSDFKTGSSTDGSFSTNRTYSDWKWILVRNKKGGSWKVFDCGYA